MGDFNGSGPAKVYLKGTGEEVVDVFVRSMPLSLKKRIEEWQIRFSVVSMSRAIDALLKKALDQEDLR